MHDCQSFMRFKSNYLKHHNAFKLKVMYVLTKRNTILNKKNLVRGDPGIILPVTCMLCAKFFRINVAIFHIYCIRNEFSELLEKMAESFHNNNIKPRISR